LGSYIPRIECLFSSHCFFPYCFRVEKDVVAGRAEIPAPRLGLSYRFLPFPFPVKVDCNNFATLGSDNLLRSPVAKPLAEDYLPIAFIAQSGFTSKTPIF